MLKKQFYNYVIYSNGEIYSNYINNFLKHDIVGGYHQVTLSINNTQKRFKVHRLVAFAFIDNKLNKPTVNHIDGDKSNNNVNNLEWATTYENNKHAREMGLNNISKSNSDRWKDYSFREKTSSNISRGLLKSGANKGSNNPNFKYKITINGVLTNRVELCSILNLAQSTIDKKIKECVLGKKCEEFVKNKIEVCDVKARCTD